MTKIQSIKLKDNKYLDSMSIVHKKIKLNDILTYSINEIRVGKWIDGKDIYRKVIVNNNTQNFSIQTSIDCVIHSEMYVRENGRYWRSVPWLYIMGDNFGQASWGGGYYIDNTNGQIYMQLGSSLANADKMIFIIEYTK